MRRGLRITMRNGLFIAGCNDVAPGSLAQSKADLTVSPIFLRRSSYQASPYAIDDGWRNITARRCIQNFGLRAYLCLTTLAVPSCLKIHDLCGFCWLFARVAVAPALVGFQVDRGRLLFEEVGRQARQFFNVAHRLRQGLANLGAGL